MIFSDYFNKMSLSRYLVVFKLLSSLLQSKDDLAMRKRFYFAQLLVLLTIILNVLTPFVYGHVIDALNITHPLEVVFCILLGYGLIWTMSQVLVQIRAIIAFKVVRRVIRKLSFKLFVHLHQLSLRYHLDRKTGAITTCIDRIEYSVTALFWHFIFYLIPTLVEVTLIQFVLLHYFAWYYAAILSLGIIAFVLFTVFCSLWDTKNMQRANATGNESGSKAVDSLLNYETIKYFSNENYEAQRYDIALAAHENANIRSDTTLESVNLGQNFIVGATLTVMTLVAGLNVMHGILTVGDFVALNTYLVRITIPLTFFGYVIRELKHAVTNFDDIITLLNEKMEIQNVPNASHINADHGTIIFDRVYFSYNEERFALNDVSFSIKSGKSVAVVGHSGSGKTTLSRLLLRLFDVQSGSIFINKQNISQVTQESLRAMIAIVPQETMLFNDTIFYNIAYGNPNADYNTVINAAKSAHIHDFIMQLPDGYNTLVGERGLKVSGGEKQRISIARAILKNPKIFIFDEATSSLDSRTESEIQKNLYEISRGVTTLIIAHRLSTIVLADEIIVLEFGRIAERGTHTQLLFKNGIYKKMWQQQKMREKQQEPTVFS